MIFANIWRGVPFVAITLLAGLQTVSPSLYEAATLDGATRWQRFRFITYPLLTPIIAVVMTFSVLFTFTDFQLIWALTRGGPVNATHLMATLCYQRGILGGRLGEGAAIATAMIPFLLAAITISWFGMQRRKWQQGETMTELTPRDRPSTAVLQARRATVGKDDHSEGMSYLESLPRRLVTLYLPLSIIVVVLLFPFYWMALTAIKPDEQLIDLETVQPVLDLESDVQAHPQAAVRKLLSAVAVEHDVCGGRRHDPVDRRQRAGGLCDRAAALSRRAMGRRAIFLAYLVPPSILFIPLATVVFQYGLFDTPLALILTYPTILIPFSTWLLMGYFKTIPFELEECALIDGASRWQILTKIVLPLAIPGLISAFIFCFTLCWNEFIYALTFLHLDAEQDGAGRHRQRIRRRRHLPLGLADGRRAGRLAAAGDPLRVLRRALRVGDDRRREGVSAVRPGPDVNYDAFSSPRTGSHLSLRQR